VSSLKRLTTVSEKSKRRGKQKTFLTNSKCDFLGEFWKRGTLGRGEKSEEGQGIEMLKERMGVLNIQEREAGPAMRQRQED